MDLIDRAEVQYKMLEILPEADSLEWYEQAKPDEVKDLVDELYSIVLNANQIDAQPVKQGKWLETHCDLICGVCKWEYSDELPYMSRNGYDSYYEAFTFCPHCGSRLSPPDDAVYEIEDFGGDNDAKGNV
jgi:hypothetical protein